MTVAGALLLIATPMVAGTITGSVLEEASGRPLARTIVRLQAIGNASSSDRPKQPLETRTSTSGAFTFPIVPDGLYSIVATRAYYFTTYYGQRRPDGQGLPVAVNHDSSLFAQIRMRRMGVVTGRVLDENDIGMTNVTVVAYRARFPLHIAGRGVSDDRGVFRIFNLDPGKYWVRTTAAILDDGAVRVPTFGPEGLETRDARFHEVHVDQETPFADLRPMAGRLFHIAGSVNCPSQATLTLTLSSELERKTLSLGCGSAYRFDGLAPGPYELFAESTTTPPFAGFVEQFFDRDNDAVTIGTGPLTRIEVLTSGRPRGVDNVVSLMGHRQDLTEVEKDRPIPMTGTLAPGHWIMSAVVGPTQYVEDITGAGFGRAATRPPDAFDVMIQGVATRINVRVSDRAAQMEGVVLGPDSKPVAGAPVMIWAVTESARRSIGGSRQTLAGADGRYLFTGLPPGDYRIIATFDIREVDADILDYARIDTTRLAIGEKKTADLSLWIAP
jgi:hypothetical protein